MDWCLQNTPVFKVLRSGLLFCVVYFLRSETCCLFHWYFVRTVFQALMTHHWWMLLLMSSEEIMMGDWGYMPHPVEFLQAIQCSITVLWHKWGLNKLHARQWCPKIIMELIVSFFLKATRILWSRNTLQ